jgi:streptomycin 6-kinase
VRLLASDEERRAMVIERCEPGVPLWVVEEREANRIGAGILRRLWRPAPEEHRFRTVEAAAARWADALLPRWQRRKRAVERALVEEAVALCSELAGSQGELVVCHQDFHGGNIISAARRPWLAIDPMPLVGEREFDTASLLRDRRAELLRDPHPARCLRRRLDRLSSELELDAERMRGWAIVHALAWGLSERSVDADSIACARLFAESEATL